MKRTKAQNSRLYSLFGRLGIYGRLKADLVVQYTGGRTIKSSEMSYDECQALINYLQSRVYAYSPEQAVLDKKRKRVISHLKEAGFILPDGKADMQSIYAWVKRQKHKKGFNEHTDGELSELIHAAAQVKDYFLSKLSSFP